MSDVTIKYKGLPIATMDATGSKTLQTQGKYCEGDIGVEYVKPAAPTGTKQISITENGTTTEDVAAYANAEITVNVQGSGGGVPIESGVFTVATKTKTYDINHSLGAVPNFVFIYPIDVHTETDAYIIGAQVTCGDFGQANWTIGTHATVRGANHSFGIGTGYSVGVHGIAGQGDNLPETALSVTYAGLFTDRFVRVGGANATGGSGWLLGTYGYIIGVMPIETSGA